MMSNFYAVVQPNKNREIQFVFETLIVDSQTHRVINSINYYANNREEIWQFLLSLNIPVAEFLPNQFDYSVSENG